METDARGDKPTTQDVIVADEMMRTRWMRSYTNSGCKKYETLTEAIKHHRDLGPYRSATIHGVGTRRPRHLRVIRRGQLADSKGGDNKGPSPTERAQPHPAVQEGYTQCSSSDKQQNGSAFKLEKKNRRGKLICRYYNKGQCSREGCKFAHACNYPGCHRLHPRCENHEVRPPMPSNKPWSDGCPVSRGGLGGREHNGAEAGSGVVRKRPDGNSRLGQLHIEQACPKAPPAKMAKTGGAPLRQLVKAGLSVTGGKKARHDHPGAREQQDPSNKAGKPRNGYR